MHVNPTGVDGLHVAPVQHSWSSQDFRRWQYQPAHTGSHMPSIHVSMPTRASNLARHIDAPVMFWTSQR